MFYTLFWMQEYSKEILKHLSTLLVRFLDFLFGLGGNLMDRRLSVFFKSLEI
jgi:hypothetical protein